MHKGLPFSKPKVRLVGNPGEAQGYLGAAYSLLFQVRAFCEASGATVFAMSRPMEDGARVTAAVVGDEHIVSCTPPQAEEVTGQRLKDEVDPRLFLASGWFRRTTLQAPGDPLLIENAGMLCETTGSASTTWGKIEKLVSKRFYPDYGDEEAGLAFGIGIDYDGLYAEDKDKAKLFDGVLLQGKMDVASRFIGRATGLFRCYLKGHLGRHLHGPVFEAHVDNPDVFFIDGSAFLAGGTGIVFDDVEGVFWLVRIAGGVTFQRLRLHRATRYLVAKFTIETDPRAKHALATYILAYATLGNEKHSVDVPDGATTGIPISGGWHFPLNKTECMATFFESADSGTDIKVQKLHFRITKLAEPAEDGAEFDITCSATRPYFGNYASAASPPLWLYSIYTGEMARWSTGFDLPDDNWVTAYVHYDMLGRDVKVQTRSVKVTTQLDIKQVRHDETTFCGSGKAELSYRNESEKGSHWAVRVLAGQGDQTYAGDNTGYFFEFDGVATFSGVEKESTWGGAVGSPCAGYIPPNNVPTNLWRGKGIYGLFSQKTETKYGGDAISHAFILPHNCVDAPIIPETIGKQIFGTRTTTDIENAVFGLNMYYGPRFLGNVMWPGSVNGHVPTGGGIEAVVTDTSVSYQSFERISAVHVSDINAEQSTPVLLQAVNSTETNGTSGVAYTPVDEYFGHGRISFLAGVVQSWHGEHWSMTVPGIPAKGHGVPPPTRVGNNTLFFSPVGFQ